MCRCSFCLPRRGSYGASDWIHWTGHHGTPHGEESPEGGIPPRRPQPKPRARGRARPGGRESRHLAARRRSAVRGGDHHAAQLARRRARRAREGWHHRGGAAWADLRGHVHHLADRLPTGRQGPRLERRRDARRARVRRGEGRHRRDALDHGRWREGGVRRGAADLPGDGSDDHASRPARVRRVHEARQPDHRGREPHGARRGAHAREEGGARSRAHAHRARGRARRVAVPRPEAAELRREHVPARLQDRPPLQGPRAHHGLGARARRAAAGDGRRPGAVQRASREGAGRPRPFRRDHPARRPRRRVPVRATVDRAGLDPQGRLPKIQVRRVRKGDLSKVRDVFEQTFGDFLERQLGTRPRQAFGGAQYVHHRWLMEPWGCFVAEEDNAKIVGTALAVAWGSVGLLGPVAVLTNYQNQTIGQQLIRATQEFFDENKTALQGVMTYPTSPKHLALYHKFGYRPKALTALMSRVLDRSAPRPTTKLARGPLSVRRYSQLEETKKKAALGRVHRITNAVYRGLDLSKEVEIVDGLALGDTLLLERGRDLVGFAVVHTPGVSEAPSGSLYVKYMVIDPAQKRVEHLEQFVAAVEDLGHELGVQRVTLPVYLRYWLAYSTLVRCGYQIDFTMLRMQKGKQEDYEDPTHLVLDDWR